MITKLAPLFGPITTFLIKLLKTLIAPPALCFLIRIARTNKSTILKSVLIVLGSIIRSTPD